MCMDLETLKKEALEIVMNDERYAEHTEVRNFTLGYLLTHGDPHQQSLALRVISHYGHMDLQESVFMTPMDARRFDTGDNLHSDPRNQNGILSLGRHGAVGSIGPNGSRE